MLISTGLVQMPVLLGDHFKQKFCSLNLPMEVELTHLNFLCTTEINMKHAVYIMQQHLDL